MPQHQVSLKVANEIPIGNVDIVIAVRRETAKFGEMTVSKGGVDWRPRGARSVYSVTWAELAGLMEGRQE